MRIKWLVLMSLGMGCGSPVEVDVVPVTVNGVLSVSPTDPGEFVVSVRNNGGSRITWGMGSSSCQLSFRVISDGHAQFADFRGCTADLVEHGLGPKETRSETFTWDGHVSDIEGRPFLLPSGTYEVFGVAGEGYRSEMLRVRVVNPA